MAVSSQTGDYNTLQQYAAQLGGLGSWATSTTTASNTLTSWNDPSTGNNYWTLYNPYGQQMQTAVVNPFDQIAQKVVEKVQGIRKKFMRLAEEVSANEGEKYVEPLDELRLKVSTWLGRA